MRVSCLLALVCLVASSLSAQTPVVRDFTATAQGDGVYLEWRSGSEQGVSGYGVERSFDGETFLTIGTVEPRGDNSLYRFTDSNLFKGEVRTIYYRVRIDFRNQHREWSETLRVNLSVSSVRRTWGSIKAMFR